MASKYLIYALTDPRNGQWRYIGQSFRGMARPLEHQNPSQLKKFANSHKGNWIIQLQALGLMYEVEILEEFGSAESLSGAEVEWIAAARAAGVDLTNKTAGGEGASGRPCSNATRALISLGNSGKKHDFTVAHRASLSKANLGKPNSRKGIPISDDTRAKMSRSRGGRPFVDGTGRMFNTTREAGKALGISHGCVSSVLKGEQKQHRGHVFRFVTPPFQSFVPHTF